MSFAEEVVKRANEQLEFVEEYLTDIMTEIKHAKEQYEKDRRWDGNEADRGYLDSIRTEYLRVKSRKDLLEMILGTQSSNQTTNGGESK